MTLDTSINPSILSQSGVTIERLKSFCEIVAAGSMVAAAGGDPVRQSHFSRQVRDLEAALGLKLFVKVGKFLRPTEHGKQLAVLTNAYFLGLQDIQTAARGERTRVRIGAGESVMRWLVLPHLTEILAVAESHSLEFLTARTNEVIESVRTGAYELGIVREDALDQALVAVECGALKYSLVVPRSILPGRSAAGIDHTKTLPIATLAGEGQFARNSLDLLRRNGIEPVVRVRTQSFSLLIEAARAAEIAAFVPQAAIGEFPQDRFAVVDLDGIDQLGRKLYLVCDPGASALRPVARALGSRIAQICRTPLPHVER